MKRAGDFTECVFGLLKGVWSPHASEGVCGARAHRLLKRKEKEKIVVLAMRKRGAMYLMYSNSTRVDETERRDGEYGR